MKKLNFVITEQSPNGKRRCSYAITIGANTELLSAIAQCKYPGGVVSSVYPASSLREAGQLVSAWNYAAQKRGELWNGRDKADNGASDDVKTDDVAYTSAPTQISLSGFVELTLPQITLAEFERGL